MMEVEDRMMSKMKEIKLNISNKFGHFSQKNDKNQRIINISSNNNLNHNLLSTSDHINQTMHIELEHFKNNGLLYSNILKAR